MKVKKRELYRAFTKDIKAFGLLVIAVETITYTFSFLMSGIAKKDTWNLFPKYFNLDQRDGSTDHQLCKTGQFRFCGKMENQGEIQRKKCIVKLCVEGIAESGAGD